MGTQQNLPISNPDECTALDIPDAEVYLYPSLFAPRDADALLSALRKEIAWKQEKIKLYGREHAIPRLTAWYGDQNTTYVYSGIKVEASPWTASLLKIKETVELVSAVAFNSVLLNLYRDGSDSVSWHSDDEPELGDNPVIGSVSLGAERPFHMKHKTKMDKDGERLAKPIPLTHGSYLLMKGPTQHHWVHQIPKSKKDVEERINLTFRVIH